MISLSYVYNATRVKNSSLISWITETNSINYDLIHYDTTIMKIRNNEVTEIKPCSHSSIRSINQVLEYLGFNERCKDIVKDKLSKGETIDKSY